ncbi:MAG: cysteine synthase family protein [Chloroflexota bacterium]|nr:cysteine synthase family protein [Chloroflexota bacterium]
MSGTRTDATLDSVLGAIGDTPVVELSRLTKGLPGRLVVKLDYLQPGFSKKDRVALRMIEDAEASGALRPGQPVVELTSGNAGTGFSIVCAIKGYHFVAVMSRGNSEERARMMRALGAEVVLVDQLPESTPGKVSGADLDLVEAEAQRIVRERGAFRPDQFRLRSNYRAHRDTTGPELVAQTGGAIDAFCDMAGSGGTVGGTSAALKQAIPGIKCFVVEPVGAAVLAGKPIVNADHRIQGAGYSRSELANIPSEVVDGFLTIDDEAATETTRRLAREEGIFAGFSSGANVSAALELLQGEFQGGTVATIINDSGLKYLSTDLWD